MISSTVVAFILVFCFDDATLHTGIIDGSKMKLLIATGFTTIAWLVATFLGGKESDETLVSFYKLVHPGGPGMGPDQEAHWGVEGGRFRRRA